MDEPVETGVEGVVGLVGGGVPVVVDELEDEEREEGLIFFTGDLYASSCKSSKGRLLPLFVLGLDLVFLSSRPGDGWGIRGLVTGRDF